MNILMVVERSPHGWYRLNNFYLCRRYGTGCMELASDLGNVREDFFSHFKISYTATNILLCSLLYYIFI